MKVGIIGAGPAGLTAAYELSHRGIPVDVFEAGPRVGGLAASIRLWNQTVDLGPHRFFSNDRRVNRLWLDIVGKDYRMVDRLTRIYYRNTFCYYPLRPLDALSKAGWKEACHITTSYVVQQLENLVTNNRKDTYESWIVSRFGKRLYDIFFKTYSEKLWGIPCSELDLDFAAQRVKSFSLFEALAAAVVPGRGNRHATLVDQFAYPLEGTGMVYRRMADAIQKRGGRIYLNCPVKRVVTRNHVLEAIALHDGSTRGYDHVISTMPLSLLVRRLPEASEDVVKAAESLPFRNTILVYLKVARDDLFRDNWIYIHSDELQTGRITNFRNWVPTLYGDQSGTILCLEFWCSDDDALWTADDASLVELAKRELRQTGLVGDALIEDGHVHRIHRCYPVYRKGYKTQLETIRSYLDRVENLMVIGRYGSFKYNNQDHSILMGILAAENLTGVAKHDLWSVNTDYRSYYEAATITDKGLRVPERTPVDASGYREFSHHVAGVKRDSP